LKATEIRAFFTERIGPERWLDEARGKLPGIVFITGRSFSLPREVSHRNATPRRVFWAKYVVA
jgi:hypothetical protein